MASNKNRAWLLRHLGFSFAWGPHLATRARQGPAPRKLAPKVSFMSDRSGSGDCRDNPGTAGEGSKQ